MIIPISEIRAITTNNMQNISKNHEIALFVIKTIYNNNTVKN